MTDKIQSGDVAQSAIKLDGVQTSAEELLYIASQQAWARGRYNPDDTDLIRESLVIEGALRHAAGATNALAAPPPAAPVETEAMEEKQAAACFQGEENRAQPVAWSTPIQSGRQLTSQKDVADRWRENGHQVDPLYLAAQPPVDRDAVYRAIESNVRSEPDKHFIDRRWLVGVNDAVDAIMAMIPPAPSSSAGSDDAGCGKFVIEPWAVDEPSAGNVADLIERMKACAFYDFDTVEMVECKWTMWEEILNVLTRAEPQRSALSHADLCVLSRIYNDRDAPAPHGTNFRINEWLKAQIALALSRPIEPQASPVVAGLAGHAMNKARDYIDYALTLYGNDIPGHGRAALALLDKAIASFHEEPEVETDKLWQELLDKDDRTSPEEYPTMALITFDELKDFVSRKAIAP